MVACLLMFVVSSYLLYQPSFNIKYDDDNDDVDDGDDDDDDDDVQERKTRLISCVPVLDKT